MASDSGREILGSMFVGTAVSFMLHGITCCQAIWYFRSQSSRSSKGMKALIVFIWLGETFNCIFMFILTLNGFLGPAVTRARQHSESCRHWSAASQMLTSSICTFSVEGFFILRMWKLSEQKKFTALAFIPYLVGHAFGLAQLIYSFAVRCKLAITDLNPVLIFGTYSCRLLGDGVVAVAMCYMLYTRSSGFRRHTNTIKIVRALSLWSISTGILTWLNTALFLGSYVGALPSGYGFYFVRGGLYVNAMLAQLNARTRFREMAEATIPLSSLNLDSTSLAQPDHHESQPLEPRTKSGTAPF